MGALMNLFESGLVHVVLGCAGSRRRERVDVWVRDVRCPCSWAVTVCAHVAAPVSVHTCRVYGWDDGHIGHGYDVAAGRLIVHRAKSVMGRRLDSDGREPARATMARK